MATKRPGAGAKQKSLIKVALLPGKHELQGFLRENSKLFNISELERSCEIPSAQLRHICAGSANMETRHFEKLKKHLLPKLCQFVFLLQHYD